MKTGIKKLAPFLFFSGLCLAGRAAFTAEFEVVDRFSVDGAAAFYSTTTILVPTTQRTELWVSTSASTPHLFVSTSGRVGIGTSSPANRLEVVGGSSMFRGSDSEAVIAGFKDAAGNDKVVISTSGTLDVSGGVKVGTVTANCTPNLAGTLRWYDGHMSVCNGANWRQLDNQAPPSLTSISPDNGPVSGGTALTITGTGFVPGPELLIGGIAATNVAVVSVTQITATAPASGTAGSKAVKLTNPDGQNISGSFTYNPLPMISQVNPNNGRLSGGNTITITGSQFVSGATVKINNIDTSVTFISAAELRTATPASASTGSKDVLVTNPDGGFSSPPGGFTYNPVPTITGVSPASGPQGTVVTINGSNFGSGAGVSATIGGTTAASVTWLSATQIRVTTPADTVSGAKTVTVTTSDTGYGERTAAYTYTVYATGGDVSSLGGYRVHTYTLATADKTFTVATGGNVEVLVVAGGGGGGGRSGGGGGAGGMICNLAYAVTAGAASAVTVGAGGSGGPGDGSDGTNGNSSVFKSLTAAGGGQGGSDPHNGGYDGGSGGGGKYGIAGGTGVSGQGYRGGTGFSNPYAAGGGGGAGGVGIDGTSGGEIGDGGPGAVCSITGATYAGGGGGGSHLPANGLGYGGSGGGGNGGAPGGYNAGASGTPNTGGGGGGGSTISGSGGAGGSGGSGIVIVRYPN